MKALLLPKILLLAALIGLSYGKCCCKCKKKSKDDASKSCAKEMEEIHPLKVPCTNMLIEFKNSTKVNCGNKISYKLMAKQPKIVYDASDKCELATVILMDYKQIELLDPYLHLLLVNWKTSELKTGDTTSAEAIYQYIPTPLGGDHVYLFYVFCQTREIDPKKYPLSHINFTERFKFSVEAFLKKEECDPNPLCGNYYYCVSPFDFPEVSHPTEFASNLQILVMDAEGFADPDNLQANTEYAKNVPSYLNM